MRKCLVVCSNFIFYLFLSLACFTRKFYCKKSQVYKKSKISCRDRRVTKCFICLIPELVVDNVYTLRDVVFDKSHSFLLFNIFIRN